MNALIGIRREDFSRWERRAPLIPLHIRALIQNSRLEFRVQSSSIRVFSDAEYRREGAAVAEDLSACSFIFALKEIPLNLLEKGKVYIFFSHTAKGQVQNMPMLKKMMELGCTLIDYEKVADEKGKRLLFSGNQAGHAGMINTLWALGRRLKLEGIDTPFAAIRQAREYASLVEAKEEVAKTGWLIHHRGLPSSLDPLVCAFLGYGHVSQGAQEIFDLLPFEEVLPRDIAGLFKKKAGTGSRLYKSVFKEADLVKPADPSREFELQDYYRHPGKYIAALEPYLPFLTVLVNGIYWTPHYPRFVTKKALRALFAGRRPRLRVIGDITCDVNGSIESTVLATDPESPVYVYDPDADKADIGFEGNGPVVMAVYNLPAELPLESSVFFSQALKAYVPAIAGARYEEDFTACNLPPEVKRAVILFQGKLTPEYEYLSHFLK